MRPRYHLPGGAKEDVRDMLRNISPMYPFYGKFLEEDRTKQKNERHLNIGGKREEKQLSVNLGICEYTYTHLYSSGL